jgi:chemotaxis regulatin CheY-phosphate phosphatase CheZ
MRDRTSRYPPAEGGAEASALQDHQLAWEAFAGSAMRLIPVLKAQMASVTDETERAVMDLLVHLRVLSSSEAGLTAGDRSASLTKVVMAMQFQDITRQRLEHVAKALDQWNNHLQALLKRPHDEEAKRAIAALQRIEQHYTMEEERRLHEATVTPDYQEPVPMDLADKGADSVTLF